MAYDHSTGADPMPTLISGNQFYFVFHSFRNALPSMGGICRSPMQNSPWHRLASVWLKPNHQMPKRVTPKAISMLKMRSKKATDKGPCPRKIKEFVHYQSQGQSQWVGYSKCVQKSYGFCGIFQLIMQGSRWMSKFYILHVDIIIASFILSVPSVFCFFCRIL
jgi:hypothetical protein